jgi:intergrase/recombinase
VQALFGQNSSPIDPTDPKTIDLKLNNSASVSQKEVGRSSSLVRTLALRASYDPNQINWTEFSNWISKKYSKNYVPTILSYSKRFHHLLSGNLRDIDMIPSTTKNNTIKSLIILAKFLGIHQEFKHRLQDYGVKMARPDVFASFLRIYNNHNTDLLKWYSEAVPVIRENEKLLLKFLLRTGVRKEEGLMSFNKIIELSRQGNLSIYYNDDFNALQHFVFKELFLRNTKNLYVSIIEKSLVMEIANSNPVTYEQVRKRLLRHSLKLRINELRDFYGSFMVRHNLIKEEVDLLQGRIPPSIFLRHYWSPSFRELRDRVMTALTQLEQQIQR